MAAGTAPGDHWVSVLRERQEGSTVVLLGSGRLCANRSVCVKAAEVQEGVVAVFSRTRENVF